MKVTNLSISAKGGLWRQRLTSLSLSCLIRKFNFPLTLKSFVFTLRYYSGLSSRYSLNWPDSLRGRSIPSKSNLVYCLTECCFTLDWPIYFKWLKKVKRGITLNPAACEFWCFPWKQLSFNWYAVKNSNQFRNSIASVNYLVFIILHD